MSDLTTRDPQSFKLPLIADLFSLLNNLAGSYDEMEQFFHQLDVGHLNTEREEFRKNYKIVRILMALIEDERLFDKIVEAVPTEDQQKFLSAFIYSWRIWRTANNAEYDELKMMYTRNRSGEFLESISVIQNDIRGCISSIDLISAADSTMERAFISLNHPNKETGPSDALIMHAPLTNFLASIRILLRSLILDDDSRDFFGKGQRTEEREQLLNELKKISDLVEKLNDQIRAHW